MLASLLFLLYAPWGIMALSYNSLGLLFLLGCCLTCLDVDPAKPILKPALVTGLCFGCAVLCCPHLVLAWLVAAVAVTLSVVRAHRRATNDAADARSLLRFFLTASLGALLVGVAFLGFVFSRATLSEVLAAVPHILDDPKHSARTPLELLTSLVNPIQEANPSSLSG